MKLYHFTAPTSSHLGGILQDRRISLTDSNILPDGSGQKVVWLTKNPDPSPEVQKWVGPVEWKTKCRITVEISAKEVAKYPAWAKKQGIHPAWMDALAEAGGDPNDWYLCFQSVSYKLVTKIELMIEGATVLEGDLLRSMFFSSRARKSLALPKTKKVRA
jgi:hypothetical protein